MRLITTALVTYLFILSISANATEINVKMAWDADVISDSTAKWKEIKIFTRVDDQQYNFDDPSEVIPQEYIEGKSRPTEIDRSWTFDFGKKSTRYWVARAYDDNGYASDSSNEISQTINLELLKAFTITAKYLPEDNTIEFSWANDDTRVKRYRIYSSSSIDGEFMPINRINTDGTIIDYTQKIPASDLFPANEKTTVYFMLRSFGDYSVFSPDSNIVDITIDRVEPLVPNKVFNFKLILE